MKTKTVSVLRSNNIEEDVKKLIDDVNGLDNIDQGDSIVIKPNICKCVDPEGHIITDFQVLRSVIRYAKEKTSKVFVGESDASKGSTLYRMLLSGTIDLIEKENAKFIDFSKDKQVEISKYGVTDNISKTIIDSNLFINIPKIKTHEDTLLTCATKNMFGILSRGDKWKNIHLKNRLNEFIIFSALVVPKQLVIVDGINAMEGVGPIGGDKVELGLLLSGTDVISTDVVVSHLVGFDPNTITHLTEVYKKGIGEIELSKINLLGQDLNTLKHKLVKPEEVASFDKSIYNEEHPHWACSMEEARKKYGDRLKELENE